SPFTRIPIVREGLHETLLNAIDRHSKRNEGTIALVNITHEDATLTFKQIHDQSLSVAGYLQSIGFSIGDVAAACLPNSNEWPIYCIGVWASGGIVTLASAASTSHELERQLINSCATVVFTDDIHLKKTLIAVKNCEKVKTVIALRTTEERDIPEGIVDWSTVIVSPPIENIVKVDADSTAILPYSSGTTGTPKGVMMSHRGFNTMMRQLIDHWEREIYPMLSNPDNFDWANERFMLNLPFYHAFGFGNLIWSLIVGSIGIVMEKFSRRPYLEAIEKYRPRMILMVPPILVFLTKQPIVSKFDLSSIEFIATAAAPAGKDLCEEFQANHPYVNFLTQAYGMTELGVLSHVPLLEKRETYAACGVIASYFEQKIICPSTGKTLGIGEKGELCVRSPTVMTGYLGRPDATREAIDEDGWMHTGDIAYVDSFGSTYIVDRLKELIKVKGYQVPPAELEDLLLSHSGVADVAIIGIPDERDGELVRAYIVKKSDNLTEEEVIDFVAEKVSSYKHITGGVIFIDEIPK
ncbi:hypothetical protein PRIPAC_88133, partial [Pristionchus pacificus]